jgi:hypothetical protein
VDSKDADRIITTLVNQTDRQLKSLAMIERVIGFGFALLFIALLFLLRE